jgi:adenylyl-sulfate kinase
MITSFNNPSGIPVSSSVNLKMREDRQGHKSMVFWLTGLSGSGKSTLAYTAEEYLFAKNFNIVVLDGDTIRKGLCQDLGFLPEDRKENNRRVAELAKIFMCNGSICLCAFISPYEESRRQAREIIGHASFREIYIDCSLKECELRDTKGFYRQARSNLIPNFTGISSRYEIPPCPDLRICTENASVAESVGDLTEFIECSTRK